MSIVTSHVAGSVIDLVAAGLLGGFLTQILGKIGTVGRDAGAALGTTIVQTINRDLDPEIRAIVIAELQSIAQDAEAQSQTVVQTAQNIMGRIAPKFPQTTLLQVATIVGEFCKTFEAGLIVALADVPPVPHAAMPESITTTTTVVENATKQ